MAKLSPLMLLLILLSCAVHAVPNSAVYYSLWAQNRQQTVIAERIFAGQQGGVWISNKVGQVRFYDGQHVVPKNSSVLPKQAQVFTYYQGDFWYVSDNKLYQSSPSGQPKLIFSLLKNTDFRTLGHSNGKVWLADADYLHSFDIQSQQTRSYSINRILQGSTNEVVRVQDALYIDDHWLIATNKGVYSFTDSAVDTLPLPAGIGISSLLYNPDNGQIVVGSHNGVLLLDQKQGRYHSKYVATGAVTRITLLDGVYWIGTKQGLYLYDLTKGKVQKIAANYQDDFALPSDYIFDLAADNQGGIWISTDKGMSYFSRYSALLQRVRFGQQPGRLTYSNIHQVVSDEQGGAWLATQNGLVHVQPNEKISNKTYLALRDVQDVVQIEQLLWLVSSSELIRLDRQTGRHSSVDLHGTDVGVLKHIAADKQGNLWLASQDHLLRYQPDQQLVTNYSNQWIVDEFSPATISELFVDQHDRVWIGTDHGLYRFEAGHVRFENRDSMQTGIVSLAATNNDYLWQASSLGLAALDISQNQLMNIRLQEDSSAALCVVAGQDGVWVVTTKGINFYNRAGLQLQHFAAPFGVVDGEFLPDACALSKDGTSLVLGSKLGLVMIDTERLLATNLPNMSILIGEVLVGKNSVQIAPQQAQHIRLPYGQSISLLFGVLPSFNTPRVQYRLLGSNNESWVEYQGTQLTFDYLVPGQYILEVKTSSQIGRSTRGTRYHIQVDNPWYFSAWFVVLSIVLVVSSVFAFALWRMRFMRRTNVRLRRLINLKTNQLQHQSRILVGSNAQLRKQVATRQLLINDIASEAQQNLQQMGRYVVELPSQPYREPLLAYIQTVKQNISQILALHIHKDNADNNACLQLVSPVINAVVQGWQQDAQKAGVTIVVTDLSRSCAVHVKKVNLDTVLNCSLAGALLRCHSGEKIILSARQVGSELLVSIEDRGRGFSAEEMHAYQALQLEQHINNDTATLPDTSLSSLAYLVRLSGGVLEFESHSNQNITTINLRWPYQLVHRSAGTALGPHQPRRIGLANHVIQTVAKARDPSSLSSLSAGLVRVNKADSAIQGEDGFTTPDPWLTKVYQLIEEHYPDSEFSTSKAAKMLFVSERSLQRKFKNLTGRSFMDYVIEVRLDSACEMLMSGQKIADIAFESGFNDPSYFSQRFKSHFGLSPSKFIENSLHDS